MPFTPKDWRDHPDTSTPLTAAAIEDLETRVTDYTDDEVATEAAARAAADSAHEADTTNVHGIADTSAVVLTNDARLSDQRVPTDGSVTAAKVAGSLKPSGTAAAGDEALRALGTSGSTAAAGNDSRLSDARTPTGAAGGVLSGTYPNPGFAADMATQAELDAHEADTTSVHGIANTADVLLRTLADAKGDLLAASAADTIARLAVGTDGHVLTADSAQAVGVKWAAAGPLSNLSATSAPTVNDDSGDGYGVGSLWVDTTNDAVWMAVDVTVGAAVWRPLSAGAFLDSSTLGVSSSLADNASRIQAGIDALATAGGGMLQLPAGTLLTSKITLKTGVHLVGCGIEATVLKLVSGALTNLIETENWATLTGTDTESAPYNYGLHDLTIDANKAQNTSGTGHAVASYGFGWMMTNLIIRNARSSGLYSEWASTSTIPDKDSMEALLSNFKIHDCRHSGIYNRGPHDLQASNGIVYRNGTSQATDYAIDMPTDGFANGSTFNGVHVWGGTFGYGVRCASSGILFADCQFEGGTVGQMLLQASIGQIEGCKLFSGGVNTATAKGIVMANSLNAWRIRAKVENLGGGAIDLGSGGGPHDIEIYSQYYAGATAPDPIFLGTLDANTRFHMFVVNSSGAATTQTRVQFPGRLSIRQLRAIGTAPTPTVDTGAGTGSSGLSLSGGDLCGEAGVTIGTSPTAGGVIIRVTFAVAFSSAPRVVIAPRNAKTASLGMYVAGVSTTTFTVATNTTPTAGDVLLFDYVVIQ